MATELAEALSKALFRSLWNEVPAQYWLLVLRTARLFRLRHDPDTSPANIEQAKQLLQDAFDEVMDLGS